MNVNSVCLIGRIAHKVEQTGNGTYRIVCGVPLAKDIRIVPLPIRVIKCKRCEEVAERREQ